MLSKQELINEALSLPVEERTFVIDSLLQSLNPIDKDIEQKWIKVSKRRLTEMRTGKVKGIPGDEVFDDIWKRFEK